MIKKRLMRLLQRVLQRISSIPSRFLKSVLRLIFGFDRWHIRALCERPYAVDIVKYLNKLPKEKRGRIVEIGCGLGDIICNVHFSTKVAYDADLNVIKAAKFISRRLFGQKFPFNTFNFPDAVLHGNYDIILMVNWVHNISPKILKDKIKTYFNTNLTPQGEIIIDTVQNPGYQYNHSIDHLTSELSCKLMKLGKYEGGRKVFSIVKGSV